jgi:hypothetical protein
MGNWPSPSLPPPVTHVQTAPGCARTPVRRICLRLALGGCTPEELVQQCCTLSICRAWRALSGHKIDIRHQAVEILGVFAGQLPPVKGVDGVVKRQIPHLQIADASI